MAALDEKTEVSPAARDYLLRLARAAIADRLSPTGDLPSPPADPVLHEKRGAFVSLTIRGALRGCIGHVIGIAPLWRTVKENAVAAAFSDPRFQPLETGELAKVRIEISVLSPLVPCAPDEIRVGRDGLLVERGSSRGLLLPQVPTEYGWDSEVFLDHTCRKAGMEGGCWRDPATSISRFSAEVFSEETG